MYTWVFLCVCFVAVFEMHMVYVVQAVLELKNPLVADSQMLELQAAATLFGQFALI